MMKAGTVIHSPINNGEKFINRVSEHSGDPALRGSLCDLDQPSHKASTRQTHTDVHRQKNINNGLKAFWRGKMMEKIAKNPGGFNPLGRDCNPICGIFSNKSHMSLCVRVWVCGQLIFFPFSRESQTR